MPITVVIDDRLPFRNGNVAMYAKAGEDVSIWGPLLEKAFAKYHGTYESIVGGNPLVALNTLAGSPGISIGHNNNDIDESLWATLMSLDERDMMQSGTS